MEGKLLVSRKSDLILKAGLVAGNLLLMSGPALAGVPVPVPLIGAGAPALLLLGGAYYMIRRRRRG